MIRVPTAEASKCGGIVAHDRCAHMFCDSQLPRVIFTDAPRAALRSRRDTFGISAISSRAWLRPQYQLGGESARRTADQFEAVGQNVGRGKADIPGESPVDERCNGTHENTVHQEQCAGSSSRPPATQEGSNDA
jgi:hypothetical protein